MNIVLSPINAMIGLLALLKAMYVASDNEVVPYLGAWRMQYTLQTEHEGGVQRTHRLWSGV